MNLARLVLVGGVLLRLGWARAESTIEVPAPPSIEGAQGCVLIIPSFDEVHGLIECVGKGLGLMPAWEARTADQLNWHATASTAVRKGVAAASELPRADRVAAGARALQVLVITIPNHGGGSSASPRVCQEARTIEDFVCGNRDAAPPLSDELSDANLAEDRFRNACDPQYRCDRPGAAALAYDAYQTAVAKARKVVSLAQDNVPPAVLRQATREITGRSVDTSRYAGLPDVELAAATQKDITALERTTETLTLLRQIVSRRNPSQPATALETKLFEVIRPGLGDVRTKVALEALWTNPTWIRRDQLGPSLQIFGPP